MKAIPLSIGLSVSGRSHIDLYHQSLDRIVWVGCVYLCVARNKACGISLYLSSVPLHCSPRFRIQVICVFQAAQIVSSMIQSPMFVCRPCRPFSARAGLVHSPGSGSGFDAGIRGDSLPNVGLAEPLQNGSNYRRTARQCGRRSCLAYTSFDMERPRRYLEATSGRAH